MIKKGSLTLLLVTAAFALVMIGVLIGRSTSGQIHTVASNAGAQSSAATAETSAPTLGLLNINTATAEELAELPGIGPAIAQRIVDYRTEHGPFISVDQLTAVEGIGEKRISDIRELITTGG